MLPTPFQSAINTLVQEHELLRSKVILSNYSYEARIRNDYAVKQALENGLKPNQDPVKAIQAALELLKPFTLHGKDNNQSN